MRGGSRPQEGQALKRSRFRTSLPGGRHTDVAVAVVVVPAVDVETLGAEAADEHAVAARVEARRTHVDVREEPDATDLEVHGDEP